MNSHLEEYYGEECEHCARMTELSKKIEKDLDVTIDRYEVWHNKENMARAEELDKQNKCGGVPFFVNKKSGKTLCGEVTYNELKEWVIGE